jgi:hypothetical protein
MQIEPSGRVIGLGVHDAVTTSFGLASDGTFHLDLQPVSGSRQRLLLYGVSRIGPRDFINGLVVSEIFCWRLNSAGHAEC